MMADAKSTEQANAAADRSPVRACRLPPLTYTVDAASLDAFVAKTLRSELSAWSASGRDIVLDLSQVSFIDSAGLGLIKSLLLTLSRQDCELKLLGLQAQPKQLLTMVRLGHLIKV